MWVNYNPNPIARRVIDCSVRALCAVTGRDWEDIYWQLCALGGQMCNMPSGNETWGAFLRRDGWRRYAVPNTCPECYTVRDFARDHPAGRYVVCTNGHALAVIEGDVWDTWDSSDEVVLFYWEKEDER